MLLRISCRFVLSLILAMLVSESILVQANELPVESDHSPVPAPHFPDALHAVVWRNWQLVTPDRLAAVLETSPENVTNLAVSMGLPRDVRVPADFEKRGYITLVRRNWHLLPFNQILPLLNISPAELALRLREDDFLWLKLGGIKPKCPRVIYAAPDAAAITRAAEIKQLVEQQFGERLNTPSEPRFKFIADLTSLDRRPPISRSATNKDGLRFIYSYFAMFGDPLLDTELDPYPDGLLARLQAQGVNGVWLHVVLRQLAPGGSDFPEFGEGHEQRLKNLRKLVERADRFGIKVYLYMNEPRAMPEAFFKNRPELMGVREKGSGYVAMCTSQPQVRKWVADALAYVFHNVPKLGGVFTISASENLTNCSSRYNEKECPHCRDRTQADILVEINTAIAEGVHRSAPDAKVIVWDWGWAKHGDASGTIAKLPKSVWLMSVSEWDLPIDRGGVQSRIGEYSMSAVGPGPRALRHWKVAKENGLKTVAKVQFNITWELSAVPYLPVMDLVAEHNARLAANELDGRMLSWSLGGYPSLNLELARRISQGSDKETALQGLAEDSFGSAAAAKVRSAWTKFSQAFAEYPYNGSGLYSGPQHNGPANLLYGEPTRMAPGIVCFPYDALTAWRGPYPPETYRSQFDKVATGWAEGLKDLEAAQPLVDESKRTFAAADLRVAQAAQLHFASVANQIAFIIARDAITAEKDLAKGRRLREQSTQLLDDEISLAKRLFDLTSADSRLGFEASNQYYYVPLDLIEKVVSCAYLKKQYGTTK